MRLFAVVLALAVAAPHAFADARAMKPEARAHYQRGLALYQRGEYDAAVDELRAGLAIDPQPDLLYALGQAERRRGHCDRAIEYYESCLGLVKDPAAAAAVRVQIERCKVERGDTKEDPAQLPATPAPAAAPPVATPPVATTPPPAAPAVVAAPAPRRWSRDALGWSLVGVGLAGAAAGGALMGVAHARVDAAGDSYQQYAEARGASTLWTAGVITLSAGGALVAFGVVRLAVVGARGRR
jgi:tetratricopeptide (TPR) repeat protein